MPPSVDTYTVHAPIRDDVLVVNSWKRPVPNVRLPQRPAVQDKQVGDRHNKTHLNHKAVLTPVGKVLLRGVLRECRVSAAEVSWSPEREGYLFASKSGEHLWAGAWKRFKAHDVADNRPSHCTRRVALRQAWQEVSK